MKWHDDLSKWQERLGQVGGLLSVGAGFVLHDPREPEQVPQEEAAPPTAEVSPTPVPPDADR